MTNLLQIHEGKKGFGSQELFHDATFSINAGEHVGVIGPNGAGKSTLFKIIADEEGLDQGTVIRSRELRLGYLPQHDTWDRDQIVNDYLDSLSTMPAWEVKSLGRRLGLTEDHWDRPMKELSGGYRMRVKLLGLLGQEPNVLLLDEPTNYLDLETVLELEAFLQDYAGAFLLISHDREFLKRVTDHTLEIESGEVTKYSGNIDDYFEQKQMLRDQLERTAANQALRRAEIQRFVDRFKAKASKAKQAQSRMRMLEKMDQIEVKPLPLCPKISIPEPVVRKGQVVLSLKDVEVGYPDKSVLNGVNFNIVSGSKVAVVGQNGAGKTTLLRTIAGDLQPLSGDRTLGFEVSLGYYAQHVSEALNPKETVLGELLLSAGRGITQQEVLDLAGSLLFSGKSVDKRISVLSGGEKARVCLGKILLGRFPLLVLDEPTNHLDFYTVEGLTEALAHFAGTVVVVSHDRSFVGRVATQIIHVCDGVAEAYPGRYDEYVWSQQQRGRQESSKSGKKQKPVSQPLTQKVAPEPPQASPNPMSYQDRKQRDANLRRLERKIKENEQATQDLRKKVETMTRKLEEPSLSNGERIQLSTDIAYTQRQIEDLENAWIVLEEEKQRV